MHLHGIENSPYRALTAEEIAEDRGWDELARERDFADEVNGRLTDLQTAFEPIKDGLYGGSWTIPKSGADLLAKIAEVMSMIEGMK